MKITDDIARRPDPGREAVEALAIAGYRSGVLTHHEASQLLGLPRLEFDAFLKARNIAEHAYNREDLEHDLETLRRLEATGRMPRL